MTDEQQAVALADLLTTKYGLTGAIACCERYIAHVDPTDHGQTPSVIARVQARYADALVVLRRRKANYEAADR